MSFSLTIDAAGRVVLPKPIRDQMQLRAGARVSVEIVADKIEITPETDNQIRLVKKGKLLVLEGVKSPLGAVKAVAAAREEADERLARRIRDGR